MVSSFRNVNSQFWKSKKVFLTGHTGFKGSWLSLWLQSMGATVKGFALEPNTPVNLFVEASVAKGMISEIGDIRILGQLSKSIIDFNPDILIHMAAQPLVRLSYMEPTMTYETNVMGTLNVLESARKCKNLKAIVAVTTDKCYENDNRDFGYTEDQPMGGYDPYSSSKGCCELLISSYRRSFFNSNESPNLASVRAGNVIGGGDWSQDRLIPDILKSFQDNVPVFVRSPSAVRPWQHVLEPLSGYLILAEDLYSNGALYAGPWNFGPNDEDCKSVESILKKMATIWGEGATYKIDSSLNPHEAHTLRLDCSKAKEKLDWKPKWTLDQSLELIVNWHKVWLSKSDMKDICNQEINRYLKS